jgi:hypothetical protein
MICSTMPASTFTTAQPAQYTAFAGCRRRGGRGCAGRRRPFPPRLRRSTDLVRVCAFRIGQLYEHPCEYLPSCGLDSSGGTADFVSRRCFSVICCSSPHHLTLQAREVAHCIFIAALGSCIGTHATRRGASLAIEASELVLRRGRQNGCAGQKVGDDLATLVVDAETVVVDAELSLHGSGPVWGAESDDLNATLLVWSAGTGPLEHVND